MAGFFVDPGALRTQLVLEVAALADDGAGGGVETWTAVATLFAMLRPLEARSRFAAGQTLEATTHEATIRFRADVASGMRFRLGERLLPIVTVRDPDESGRYLICNLEEKGR